MLSSTGRVRGGALRYDATLWRAWARSRQRALGLLAKAVLGRVAHGHDPAGQKTTERGTPTIAELAERFLSEHVETEAQTGNCRLLPAHLDEDRDA